MSMENIARTFADISKPDITEIQFRYLDLTNNNVKTLSDYIATTSSLINLSLDSCKLTPSKLGTLIQGFEKNASITKLNLQNNRLGKTGLKKLTKLLDKWGQLRELSLSELGKKFNDDIKILCESLKQNYNLEALFIEDNYFNAESIQSLVDLIKNNKGLKHLVMSCGAPCSLEYLALILQGLGENQFVEVFRFADKSNWEQYYRSNKKVDCTKGSLIQNISQLSQVNRTLKNFSIELYKKSKITIAQDELQISEFIINHDAANAINSIISSIPTLHKISLNRSYIEPEALDILLESLVTKNNLTHVCIDRHFKSSAGCFQESIRLGQNNLSLNISKIIQNNRNLRSFQIYSHSGLIRYENNSQQLKSLYLSTNTFDDFSILNLQHLEELSLYRVRFVNDGLSKLLLLLKQQPMLKKIEFHTIHFTVEDCEYLTNLITSMEFLETIILNKTNIDNRFIHMIHSVKNNHQLKNIIIEGSTLGSEDLQVLAEILSGQTTISNMEFSCTFNNIDGLSSMLPSVTSLKKLRIKLPHGPSNNGEQDQLIKDLGSLIGASNKLKTLNIHCDNLPITPKRSRFILRAMEANYSLVECYIGLVRESHLSESHYTKGYINGLRRQDDTLTQRQKLTVDIDDKLNYNIMIADKINRLLIFTFLCWLNRTEAGIGTIHLMSIEIFSEILFNMKFSANTILCSGYGILKHYSSNPLIAEELLTSSTKFETDIFSKSGLLPSKKIRKSSKTLLRVRPRSDSDDETLSPKRQKI